MFCPKCGSNIADGTRFCPTCGASTAPAAPNYERPAAPNYGRPATPGYAASGRPMNYPQIMTAYGLFAIAALCVVVAILFFTGGNLANDELKILFKHGKRLGVEQLKLLGIVFGCGWLGAAGDAILAWKHLSSKSEKGPRKVTSLFVTMGILLAAYYIGRVLLLTAEFSDYPYTGKDCVWAVLYLAIGIALGAVNSSCFKKNSGSY